jgi:ankyrin repeat protein
MKGNNIVHELVDNYNKNEIIKELENLMEKEELIKIINQKNFKGLTPLHCAIKNNNQECAQQLINYGANINIPTNDGYIIKWFHQKGGNTKITGKRYL